MHPRPYILLTFIAGLLAAAGVPARTQTRADCLTCHSDQSLTKEKDGKQVSLFVDETVLNTSPHKKLVCVACHTGFNPEIVPHKEKIEPVDCRRCHVDAQLKHPFHPQLARALNAHEVPDVSCKDCHGTHDVVSPSVPGSKFSPSKLSQSCGECHSDEKERFEASAHGKAAAAGIQGAPNCLTCHSTQVVLDESSPDSLALKTAQEKLCLSCHLDNPGARAQAAPSAGFIAAYETSVHGAALARGNARAANCVSCHGSHDMRKGNDPASLVNRINVPTTCSQCHAGIGQEFAGSIHGKALAKGNPDAPVCTNCHGEHNILSPSDPKSRVAARNVSAQVCSPCHSSVSLSNKYGLASDRFQTYSDSYHGLAIRGGSVEAANCVSCHGTHNIKPSSDSTSSVNKANLAVTCGKCHPGANSRFGVGSVHVALAKGSDPTIYWVATFYIILIVVVVGGMLIHNLLDFVRKSRRRLMVRRGLIIEERPGRRLYLRMTVSERIQHGTLLVSFITLVLTGFALKYPDAWWVIPIRSISPMMFEIRGIVHRVAGVVMILAGLYHLYYLAFVPRGRQLLKDLLPVMQDLHDALGVMKYNLGLSAVKPRLGRFSYVEKSEYWALVWGTVVMGATGAILWFDNTFIGLLTKLWWDVAQTVHYYEAWLATLAIIVWHFYFVIFNPDVYPMNVAWWKGTLTEEEMREEHPLELEQAAQEGDEDVAPESTMLDDVPNHEEVDR